jgi:hypothetical protein
VLHESGHARRGPRLHQEADLVELGLIESDGDLPSGHTIHHTTRAVAIPACGPLVTGYVASGLAAALITAFVFCMFGAL